VFDNPDKKNKYRIGDEEYMPNNSSRILYSGPPDSGKRSMILNLIFRMRPSPSAIHIVHQDPETIEYDVLTKLGVPIYFYGPDDFVTLKNIESPDEVDSDDEGYHTEEDSESGEKEDLSKNPVVIIDEITADTLKHKDRMERLINYGATHKNILVICSIQSLMSIPVKSRRGFSQFCLWKQNDDTVNRLAASRAGVKQDVLDDLFKLCKSKHDSIWIDCDRHYDDKWRYRLNFILPITKCSSNTVSGDPIN
jgi:hypothetical protein